MLSLSIPLHRRLASLGLSSSQLQASATSNFCRASTSYLPSTSTSSFHTSARNSEKKRKQIARLKKKTNLSRRETVKTRLQETAPDPIRGYGPKNEKVWLDCELRRILLDRDVVWGVKQATEGSDGKAMLSPVMNERDELLGPVEQESLLLSAPSQPSTSQNALPSPTGASSNDTGASNLPAISSSTTSPTDSLPYLNFALSPSDAELLFHQLPATNAALSIDPNMVDSAASQRLGVRMVEEEGKAESLKRILDLRNANSRGIRFENTRRILRRFGQGEGSGRSEVQAAVLTMRIHSLADHHLSMPRDIHCKRGLTALVQQRAKVLKYLKRYDLERYVACLRDIGVEQRAVEGEITIRK